jgi:hypothetical protein
MMRMHHDAAFIAHPVDARPAEARSMSASMTKAFRAGRGHWIKVRAVRWPSALCHMDSVIADTRSRDLAARIVQFDVTRYFWQALHSTRLTSVHGCPADSTPASRSAAWTIASKQKSIRQSYRPMKSHQYPSRQGCRTGTTASSSLSQLSGPVSAGRSARYVNTQIQSHPFMICAAASSIFVLNL